MFICKPKTFFLRPRKSLGTSLAPYVLHDTWSWQCSQNFRLIYSTAFVVETTLHVKNTSSQLWFRVEFETRPRPFFGAFDLYKLVEKALGTRLPLGMPMGTNGILSFLRIWLMIIEICEYERHLIFRRDSSLVQLVTFSIFCCFYLQYGKAKTLHFKTSTLS